MTASAGQRRLQAKQAAHTRWAYTEDRTAALIPAREGLMRKFERQVDPAGKLPPQERAKRAESARRAFYAAISAKSVAVRQKRKEAKS